MFTNISQDEMRNACREKIESLEHWLRRLIDETLAPEFGDYLSHADNRGARLISLKITKPIEDRITSDPDRYPRKIDAILLNDAISIICNPNLYPHFSDALRHSFPEGNNTARTYLNRLVEPRNRLAHANSISVRQAEQIICYSNDIIDSLKDFYNRKGMGQEYDAPLILKVADSFGNVFHRNQMGQAHDGGITTSLVNSVNHTLRPGDYFYIDIEVDPAFENDSYSIRWASTKGLTDTKTNERKLEFVIQPIHVGQSLDIQCRITTTRDWHRMAMGSDDFLIMRYKVLPPA